MGNLTNNIVPVESGYVEKDQFAKLIGARVVASGVDYAKCELDLQEHHMNGLGGTHGGLIYALADVALAVACNSEQATVGMQCDIRFLNKTKGTRLIAESVLISKSRKIGHYQVDITDNTGVKIAQVSGTTYRLGTPV